MFNTKRFIIASIAYLTTGIGFYHTFFGDSIVYGSLILTVGLLGILHDIFYKNLYAEWVYPFTQQTGARVEDRAAIPVQLFSCWANGAV